MLICAARPPASVDVARVPYELRAGMSPLLLVNIPLVSSHHSLSTMGSTFSVFLSICYPPILIQCLSEMFPSSPKWSPDTIGDLSGTVAFVTGANTGIGYISAFELAKHGAVVYVAARSEEKGKDAVDKINSELVKGPDSHRGRAVFIRLDLSDLKSVERAAKEFTQKEERLDILLNSAGVMTPPKGSRTESGIELQFATNVLGHFALTLLLLPVLKKTVPLSPDGMVRVVNVSSLALAFAPLGTFRFNNLFNSTALAFGIYGQSKIANCSFATELARRYKDAGILSVSLDPGNTETELWRHQKSFFNMNSIVKKYPSEWGALTQLYAATSPDITMRDSGGWLAPWARKSKHFRKEATDPEIGASLWNWCEQQMAKEGVAVPVDA